MSLLIKLRKDVRTHIVRTKKKSQTQMTVSRLQWHLSVAYEKEQFWFEYFCMYDTFFDDRLVTEIKAKTHSVGNMCKFLHAKNGIAYKTILEMLRHEAIKSNWIINSTVLNLQDKVAFISSLENLPD